MFAFEQPLASDGDVELTITLKFDHPNSQHAIGRPRLSVTSGDAQKVAIRDEEMSIPADVAEIVSRLSRGDNVAAAERQQAMAWFGSTLTARQTLDAAVAQLKTPRRPRSP